MLKKTIVAWAELLRVSVFFFDQLVSEHVLAGLNNINNFFFNKE